MLLEGVTMDSALGIRLYLIALRKGRKISQEKLAMAVGVSRPTIREWESGRTEEMKGSMLLRAMAFLGASRVHMSQIITDPNLTEEDINRFAESVLGGGTVADIEALADSVPDGKIAEILYNSAELQKDPTGLDELLKFSRFLREDRSTY